MSEMNLNNKKEDIIELRYDCWEITLISTINSIKIIFKNSDSNIIYENTFELEFFQNLNSFKTYYNTKDILHSLKTLINKKFIFLKIKNENLILTLIDVETEEIILNKKKDKNKLEIFNLYNIRTINIHSGSVTSISVFPSGNFISVSEDKNMYIYNSQFEILQEIENAHNNGIYYVYVRDENNFITCSFKSIKTWIKIGNEFKEKETIINAHSDWIYKVIYLLNENIISCSNDKTIKIWEEKSENNHQCKTIILNKDRIRSLLLIEGKNILISSGYEGTKFWNLNNINCYYYIEEATCCGSDSLNQLDDDKIIVGGDYHSIIFIISIKNKNIIQRINNDFSCLGICILNNGIFLIGGMSNDIKVYKNYKCIQIINNAHFNMIFGFAQLKNNFLIASYSHDSYIKIWTF